ENGAWWAAYVNGEPKSDSLRMETNYAAYIATGVWHHFVISADDRFLSSMWPTVEKAIEFTLGLQTENGDIYWNIDAEKGIAEDSLTAGCCSIYKSLECALNIASTLGYERPNLVLARARLGNALRNHPEYFNQHWESKEHFAMDWYYPVLTGVITGNSARAHLTARWQEFVEPSLGCRCLSTNPWVTVAESCELVLALMAAGEHQKAAQLYSWLHDYRELDGAYWTGYVFTDDAVWPEEKPTWTAAAVLIAADALTEATPASSLFTDVSLPAEVEYA
ncbi:MAG: prenyltransferase, partial [Pseudomonadota bacterium]